MSFHFFKQTYQTSISYSNDNYSNILLFTSFWQFVAWILFNRNLVKLSQNLFEGQPFTNFKYVKFLKFINFGILSFAPNESTNDT